MDYVKWTIVSLILIILLHNLYLFFQKTLTVPKTKDLVNKPIQKYEELLNIQKNNSINPAGQNKNNQTPQNNQNNHSNQNKISDEDKDNMKLELQNFLNELGTNKNNITGNPLDRNNNQQNQSNQPKKENIEFSNLGSTTTLNNSFTSY